MTTEMNSVFRNLAQMKKKLTYWQWDDTVKQKKKINKMKPYAFKAESKE